MAKDLTLVIDQVVDSMARENFDRIQAAFRELLFGKFDGKFFEIVVAAAVTNRRFPHKLGFRPQDVLQTSTIGAGVLTWNYSRFSKEYLDFTTTGAVTVRAFIGTFSET